MNQFLTTTVAITSMCLSLGLATVAQAQVAEVPQATTTGDFTTAKVMGNRGYYQNNKWLVVDTDPLLNCRATPNGAVKSRLIRGSVVTAVFNQNKEAIAFHQGSPWLKVNPQIPGYGSGTPGVCFVRANTRYIAPISEDFIYNGLVRSGR
jgi:hypothetical protein